jgi:hypothetical protein
MMQPRRAFTPAGFFIMVLLQAFDLFLRCYKLLLERWLRVAALLKASFLARHRLLGQNADLILVKQIVLSNIAVFRMNIYLLE